MNRITIKRRREQKGGVSADREGEESGKVRTEQRLESYKTSCVSVCVLRMASGCVYRHWVRDRK